MNATSLVFRRLLERRLVGDDAGFSSSIPGATTTLGISLVVFGVAMQERPLDDVLLLLVSVTLVWSFVRALFDENGAADPLDRAVLEPLPVRPAAIAFARVLAIGVSLLVATANLAVPPIAMAAARHGPLAALSMFGAALAASFVGMSAAELARSTLERSFGRARLAEWEGPFRLVIGVLLFAVMFIAPSPAQLLSERPWLARLPPFSLASLGGDGAALPAALAVIGLAALALWVSIRLSVSGTDGASHRTRRAPAAEPARWRHALVRPTERAGFAFGWAQIGRDRAFRSRVHPLFAFPFAVIVLVAMRPAEPMLALMALYGAGVYAVVAESFVTFSESEGGPRLLESLPVADVAGFRVGVEKAFVVRVVLPVFLTLWFGLVVLAAFSRGPGVVASTEFALLAFSSATLLCLIGFDRLPALPFSAKDRGVYPGDAASVAFSALLAMTLLALAAAWARERPLFLAVELIALWTMIRLVLVKKRDRWNRMNASDGASGPSA